MKIRVNILKFKKFKETTTKNRKYQTVGTASNSNRKIV
jgi:hypothetical protein